MLALLEIAQKQASTKGAPVAFLIVMYYLAFTFEVIDTTGFSNQPVCYRRICTSR
jgi:hypothetical protein